MKITRTQKILIFLIALINNNNSYAWSGYDYEEKTQIDIGPGNLVREGMTIQFYDTKSDSYHTAKVILLEESSGGASTVKVEDLDLDNSERIFLMDE